jgi:hypothetical protein
MKKNELLTHSLFSVFIIILLLFFYSENENLKATGNINYPGQTADQTNNLQPEIVPGIVVFKIKSKTVAHSLTKATNPSRSTQASPIFPAF